MNGYQMELILAESIQETNMKPGKSIMKDVKLIQSHLIRYKKTVKKQVN